MFVKYIIWIGFDEVNCRVRLVFIFNFLMLWVMIVKLNLFFFVLIFMFEFFRFVKDIFKKNERILVKFVMIKRVMFVIF